MALQANGEPDARHVDQVRAEINPTETHGVSWHARCPRGGGEETELRKPMTRDLCSSYVPGSVTYYSNKLFLTPVLCMNS